MRPNGVDVVAVMLAAAVLVVVLTVSTVAVVDEVRGRPVVAFGPNATQVITDVVGSIVALLGAYIGYRIGERRNGG